MLGVKGYSGKEGVLGQLMNERGERRDGERVSGLGVNLGGGGGGV